MHKRLLEWLHKNETRLADMGITVEEVRESREGSLNPGISVEHISQTCLGQVSVWESGLMDVEVLDIESGNRLLYEHHELEGNLDYDTILKKYLRILAYGVVD